MAIQIPKFLSSFFQSLTTLWAYVRNLEARYHKLFLFTSFYGIVRLGIHLCSSLFSYVRSVAYVATSAVSSASAQASGLSFLTYFDLVNTIFPVYELFVFLGTVLTLKTALWVYVFLRTLYKNIPLKAT